MSYDIAIVAKGPNKNVNDKNSLQQPLLINLQKQQQSIIVPISRRIISKSQSQKSLEGNTIDMLRILDKREQGRISRFEQMEDLQRIKDKGIITKEEIDRHSDYVIDGNCQKAVQYGDYYVFRNQNAQRNQIRSIDLVDESNLARTGNKGNNLETNETPIRKDLSELGSLVSSYENNWAIGGLLYFVFAGFIVVQICVTVYFLSGNAKSEKGNLQYFRILLTILSAEFIYIVIIRKYFHQTSQTSTLRDSILKAYSFFETGASWANNTNLQAKSTVFDWLWNRPKLVLVYLIFLIVSFQGVYAVIIKRSLFELEGEDYNKGNVNMSTIFFAVFLIPQIAFYFFLNRVMEERACLPRIMKILLVLSLVWLTFIHPFLGLASILKISFEDLQCRFGVDLIQIDHFIKFCSVFVVAVVFLGYLISERSFTHIESWTQVFQDIISSCIIVILISLAMLGTRFMANKLLKTELFKYLYTQMHLSLALVYASCVLCLWFVKYEDLLAKRQQQSEITFILCVILGVIIFLDGQSNIVLSIESIRESTI